MSQLTVHNIYSELMSFLFHIDETGDPNERRGLLAAAGFSYLAPRLNFHSSAQVFYPGLLQALGEQGQSVLIDFVSGLQTKCLLTLSADDTVRLENLKQALATLASADWQAHFLSRAQVQNLFKSNEDIKDIEQLPPEPGVPPYMGLQCFEDKDAHLFFGRQKWIGRILHRLRQTRFLAIIGSSGSGKSSLVRAGVIPALRAGKAVSGMQPPTGCQNWIIRVFKPGNMPRYSLVRALAREGENSESGESMDAAHIQAAARKLLEANKSERLLLVVDQFEEVFTLCKDSVEQARFIDDLLEVSECDVAVSVVITLRADFYDTCGVYAQLSQKMAHNQEYITAMNRDELFEVITQPLYRSGKWQIQQGLDELMLDDVGDEPGALLLLSHVLLETWNRRRGVTLTLSGYREAGEIKGAIAKAAEDVYVKVLSDDVQKGIARSVFLRLTELGIGTQDTRRRATFDELLTSSREPPAVVQEVLEILKNPPHCLLVLDRDPLSGEEFVEVVHEALIRHWQRLRDWLDEDRILLRLRQGVQRAAAEWQANRHPSYLIHRDEYLKQVRVMLDHPHITLDAIEREYLEACSKADLENTASLEKSGWGVIFPANVDPAIPYALRELLDHRERQLKDADKANYYHEFTYQPGENKREFLRRYGVGSTRPSPDRMPYYLLIVGDLETIPLSFQYQLDMQYAVGRIHFEDEDLDAYAHYARSVVAAESEDFDLPSRMVVFGVHNEDDQATSLALQNLATPLASHLEDAMPEWKVERVFDQEASKARLGELLGGKDTPPLLFSCGHGMQFPIGDAQLRYQGSLLCSDWPGPRKHTGGLPKEFYFSGDDVSPEAQLIGSIFYFWGCYGAATPKHDNFWQASYREKPDQIAPHAFIAYLPQRLLGHPRGGALAVIGAVERKWGYSFVDEKGRTDIDAFLTTLVQLMQSYPVGAAMEYFNQRYATLMADLVDTLERSQTGEVDPRQMATRWTETNDARNYIIVGDPAVRLRVKKESLNQRPTIQAGVKLEAPEAALDKEISSAAAGWVEVGKHAHGLLHLGGRLQSIQGWGSLFTRDEIRRTYLTACRLYEEIRDSAAAWELNGRQADFLKVNTEQLKQLLDCDLQLDSEPETSYLAACRAVVGEAESQQGDATMAETITTEAEDQV